MHERLVQETSFQENNVCCLELRQLRHPADVLRQGIQPRRGRCILLGAGIEQVSCRYHTPRDVQCRDDLEAVEEAEDIAELKELVEKHKKFTASKIAEEILNDWNKSLKTFVKVMPRDYKRSLLEKANETPKTFNAGAR